MTPPPGTATPGQIATPSTAPPETNGAETNSAASNGVASNGHGGYPAAQPPPAILRRLQRGQLAALAALALVLVLVGAGVAFGGSFLWPDTYAARARVLYILTQQQPTGFLREDRNLTTQVVLLQSRNVLGPVAASNSLSVDELAKKISASVVEGSEVIEVEARDTSPGTALQLVDALTRRYLQVADAQPPSQARDYLQSQLAQIDGQLGKVTGIRAARPQDQAKLNNLLARERDLQSQLDHLNLSQLGGSQAQLVVTPYLVPVPVSPRRLLDAGAGALTGLVIALGAVALVARRWTRP